MKIQRIGKYKGVPRQESGRGKGVAWESQGEAKEHKISTTIFFIFRCVGRSYTVEVRGCIHNT
jgi:hypothetical protein